MKIGHVASKIKTTEMRSILEKKTLICLLENLQFLVTLKFTFFEKQAILKFFRFTCSSILSFNSIRYICLLF